MSNQRLTLRATWSNRVAGTYLSAVVAVALVVVGLVWLSGWLQMLIVSLGASVAVRTLLRWLLHSIRVDGDRVVYRVDLRRVEVPLAGVAAFTVKPLPFDRRRGRGVAILPDRPLPSVPAPLVTDASAAAFARWLSEHHPTVRINPTGTWQDRFGRWHVDTDSVDPAGRLTVGARPIEIGPGTVEVEAVEGGFRAVRRDGGDVVAHGQVRTERRAAVADGVDLYREALAEVCGA